MANEQLTNLTGTNGLDIVSQTKLYLNSDPQSAERYLETIKDSIPLLLTKLKEYEKERESERNALIEEEKHLMRQKGDKERELSDLRDKIRSYEAERARYNALLEDARSDLSRANDQKRSAMEDTDAAIGGTVGGGIGAALLGILFPPSLILTVPAVATAGTISIKSADEEVGRCNDKISSAEKNIANENRRISETNRRISSIEGDVYALKIKANTLHGEIGEKREAIVFFQKATTFMGKLIVAVNGGKNDTDLLHTILSEANKEEEYEILRDDGCKVIVNSFADAWKEVERKVTAGEKFGFLSIKSA